MLDEDTDGDGISDGWEYAHSPNHSLDDFGGVATKITTNKLRSPSEGEWINPYAPGESGWVRVSATDWDGDGFSNLTEFLNWKNNKTDPKGYPFDPTFINGSASFPFHLFLPAIIWKPPGR